MSWLGRRATYANVVSTVCLFLLLGGGAAYAATQLPKSSVGARQLKPNAVSGPKVKDGSLTGADIELSTLGQVPSASHALTADSATRAASADQAGSANDATTLGGLGPAAFYPANDVRRIDFAGGKPSGGTILSLDGLALSADCHEGGLAASTVLGVSASSSEPGAELDAHLTASESSGEKTTASSVVLSSTPSEVSRAFTMLGGSGAQTIGTLAYHDSAHAIAIVLELRVTGAGGCQLSGTATATA